MKSSILYAVVVLTVSCSLIVQAQECSCGKLGPGTNPCTCSDVVVKAAKLPKPGYYVSPQDINNAAAARSGAVIEPTTPQGGCACSKTASNPDAYSNSASTAYSNSAAAAYSNSAAAAYSNSASNAQSNSAAAAYSLSENANAQSISASSAYSSSSSPTAYSNSAAAAFSNSASNAQSNSQTAYSLSENANAQGISASSAYSSSSSPTAYSNSAAAAFSNSASNAQSNSQTAYSLSENANAQGISVSSAYSNSGNSNAQSISAANAYSSSSPTAYSDSSNSNAYSNSASVAYSNSDSNTYIDSSSSSSASTIDISTPVNADRSGNSRPILESLEIDDESSESSSAIVPSFPPIGDLCYPLPINPRSGKIMEKLKVTPAYPGKIVCNICNPSAPYELCVNMQTGETTSRMLTTSTPFSSASSSFIYGKPISGGSSGSTSGTFTTTDFTRNGADAGPITEAFAESNAGNLKSRAFTESNAGNLNSRAFAESNAGNSKSQAFADSNAGNSKSQAFTESNAGNLKSRAFSVINAGNLKSEAFSGASSGPFGASNLGTYGNSNSASFSRSSSGLYNMPPIVYAGRGPSGPKPYATVTQAGSSSSDCLDDTDVPEVDYSYPQVPADAVSLTLAYKNLRAPNVIYRQGKQFVPEDKLSFGHRTLPNVVKNEKKIVDIAEEKLVTVDKPVVELKIAPARTVVVGSYDEREEAKLAELEAIERESITQEETADQVSDSLITYKDLGYAPVGATFAKSTSYGGIINGDINDSAEVPCGPLGPPVPDYVPGRVVVQQQAINGGYASSGVANENLEIFSSNPLRSYPL